MQQRICPKCHAQQARRIRREGFLQQSILRRLGYYPWECRFCKTAFVLKDRGVGTEGRHRAKTEEQDDQVVTTSASGA